MRVLKIDEKHGTISVIPENEDDLWHLSKVIEPGDKLVGVTSRKEKGKEGTSAIRKVFLAEIEASDVSFDSFSKALRVNGRICGGNLDVVPLGSMQVIEVAPNEKYKIVKKELRKYHIDRIQKAARGRREEITIVVMDDESATIASFRDFKCEVKAEIRSNRAGKRFDSEESMKEYFGNVSKKIADIGTKTIVIAGPGFVKDDFASFLSEKSFSGRVYVQGTSTTGVTGLNEVIKSKAFENIARDSQLAEEARLIEKLLGEIAKGKLANYGFEQVKKAVQCGAADKVLVLDKLLEERKDETYEIMTAAESSGATVHIFNSEYEPGKKLEGLGGLAALLRYAVG